MDIKILGICGSPIKGGNTEVFLKEALIAAAQFNGVKTEMISLSGKNIKDCQQCNWCIRKQEAGKFCNIDDDAAEILPKILEADGLLLATPVYFGRLSGLLANLIDRSRSLVLGKYYRGALKNKVGGALAVARGRHAGVETAILSILEAFLTCEMIISSTHGKHVMGGGGGLSGSGGSEKFDPHDRLPVLSDKLGLESARALAGRMVELITIFKAGAEKNSQQMNGPNSLCLPHD